MSDPPIRIVEDVHSDDELDGCQLDFSVDAVTDEDLPYVVLSPEGDVLKLASYLALFGPESGRR